jgi:hypothetical protein
MASKDQFDPIAELMQAYDNLGEEGAESLLAKIREISDRIAERTKDLPRCHLCRRLVSFCTCKEKTQWLC